MELAAQLVGFVGALLTVVLYQQKDRKKMLLWKIASDGVWMIHYIMLGAPSGAANCIIACVRSAIYIHDDKKWARGRIWIAVFIVISILGAAVTWEGPQSLLTCTASVVAVIAFAMKNTGTTRLMNLPISASMVGYNIITGSIAGIICEAMALVSEIVGILRLDIKRKKKN